MYEYYILGNLRDALFSVFVSGTVHVVFDNLGNYEVLPTGTLMNVIKLKIKKIIRDQ